jgi:hypothetical protein
MNLDRVYMGDICNLSVSNVNAPAPPRTMQTPKYRDPGTSSMQMRCIKEIAREVNQDLFDEKQTNTMATFQLSLARASAAAQLNALPPTHGQDFFATSGPKNLWHKDNECIDVEAFILKNQQAYEFDPVSITKALFRLESAIRDALAYFALNVEQRDRLRQMAENAAIMKMAIAKNSDTGDRIAAQIIVGGAGYSVKNLLRLAVISGMNPENEAQVQRAADKIVQPQIHEYIT